MTALSLSSKPFFRYSDITKTPFKTLSTLKFNQFLTNKHNPNLSTLQLQPQESTRCESHRHPPRPPKFDSITWHPPHLLRPRHLRFRTLRSLIMHQIAEIHVSPINSKFYHITQSCRWASAIYAILSLYRFEAPMVVPVTFAGRLRAAFEVERDFGDWGEWNDLMVWCLFGGGSKNCWNFPLYSSQWQIGRWLHPQAEKSSSVACGSQNHQYWHSET